MPASYARRVPGVPRASAAVLRKAMRKLRMHQAAQPTGFAQPAGTARVGAVAGVSWAA
jgi:hypothetical protein